jgi:hypothetical protein
MVLAPEKMIRKKGEKKTAKSRKEIRQVEMPEYEESRQHYQREGQQKKEVHGDCIIRKER